MKNYLNKLKRIFEKLSVEVKINDNEIIFNYNERTLSVAFYTEFPNEKNKINLPLDYLVTQFEKVIYFIQSKLHLNKTVYARKCEIKKIDKTRALTFLNSYHFLNDAGGAFNYGLFYNSELLAVASYSKGRKMNRLQEHERGYELVRFCTKGGVTITGGLSKLLKHFCDEKIPGDIMTYIDKQFSDGQSFIKSGFKFYTETESNYFLINRISFKRISTKPEAFFNEKDFYKTSNFGNLKLVYTPKKLP
ncbi:MAG: hypothetical protein SFY56_03475 [Bacteroidota bacterium]|nr:hypothetical protein [Bacteroidota bacterium]